MFDFDIRIDLEAHTAQVHFKRRDLLGLSPVAALPGLHFLAACRAPHAMRIGLPYGPPNHVPLVLPDGVSKSMSRLRYMLLKLSQGFMDTPMSSSHCRISPPSLSSSLGNGAKRGRF